jgi:PmbA protein
MSLLMPANRGRAPARSTSPMGFGQSVTVRCAEIETIEYNRDKALAVTVYLGQRKDTPVPRTLLLTPLRETVDAALNIARFTAADPCAGLPDAELLAVDTRHLADLDIYHPWLLSVEAAVDLARRCEQAAFAVSPKISNSEGATLSIQEGQFISANSLGFMGGYPTSRHYLACSVIAGKDQNMQRDDWYSDGTRSLGHRLARVDWRARSAARAVASGCAQDQHLSGTGAFRGHRWPLR